MSIETAPVEDGPVENTASARRSNPIRGARTLGGALLLVALLLPILLTGCPGPTDNSGEGGANASSGGAGTNSSRASSDRKTLRRGSIWVEITETLDDQPTSLNIAQVLLSRSLAYHGFEVVPGAEKEKARYHLTGELDCDFHHLLTFEMAGNVRELEHQWKAEFELTLLDRGASLSSADDDRTEVLSFPEPMINGRSDPKDAEKDIRRKASTDMARRLSRGKILGVPEVAQLIDAWTDPFEPRTFNDVQVELISYGYAAVPYLLEALTDKRKVEGEGRYPGLADFNREELKLYHLADETLAEILNKQPVLDLLSTEKLRIRVVTGWSWHWEDTIDVPVELRTDVSKRKTKTPASPRGA